MKSWVSFLLASFLTGCITPALENLSDSPSNVEARSGTSDKDDDRIGDPEKKKKGQGDHDTSELGCQWESLPTDPLIAFMMDDCSVFLANYNYNLTDFVSSGEGAATGTLFSPSLYGAGIHPDAASPEKSVYRFPASTPLGLTTGSMEALVYAEDASGGFKHIIDKSWQYGITAYNGLLAVHFGGGWWFSSVALPLNAWSYVGATYDGVTLRLYLNGALVASTVYHGFQGSSDYELGIGNASDNGFDIPFIGTIDEVRISKCVRTSAEIAQIGKSITPPMVTPARSVAGCWNVTQGGGHYTGLLNLVQNGAMLSGNMDWYNYPDAPVDGRISGDSVSYALAYPDLAPLIGYYRATLDASGNNLINGLANSSSGDSEPWTATKTTCPVAP